MKYKAQLFNEFKCDECGKTILAHVGKNEWGWRLSDGKYAIVFCSYSCLRKFEKEAEEKRNKKRAGSKETKLRDAYQKGLTVEEATKEVRCSAKYTYECFKRFARELIEDKAR